MTDGTLPLGKAKAVTPDAGVLLRAIERRHADDLVIPECKNGPTQSGSHRRFDAWVLVRTWSPVTTIGYEIKVSRSDWRRDQKLADYQGLCHLLYVVAPKGVVPVEEVPDGIGLLESVGDHTRLVSRRKASRREIQMPVSLLVYVLMARVSPTSERGRIENYEEWSRGTRAKAIREWATTKSERREMSYLVSKKIREQFEAQERALEQARQKADGLQQIRDLVVELGFDPDVPAVNWRVSAKLRDIAGTVSHELPFLLERSIAGLQQTHDALIALRDKAGVPA